ncbi:MAG: deoxyribose-phosphate aldolase [Eubacteriales bacterium]
MIDLKNLPRIIDLSCVKTEIVQAELDEMVLLAKRFRFVCCFAMPCYTPWLGRKLQGEKDIALGGAVGFPSGADLTETKVQTAKALLACGCNELDMVINVSALKNGHYDMVEDDIRRVHKAADGHLLKVILEVAYLSDYEIQKGCELAVANGADFIKTGTGWASRPTTVEHIRLIKSIVGDAAKIKAAGGIRTLDTIQKMTDAGCSRFGIGIRSTKDILCEAGLLKSTL